MSPKHAAVRPRRIGRPPAGAREGEKVKDYPQLSVRLPPEIKARLEAVSVVSGQPQWRVISAAITCYFRELPPEDRRAVDSRLKRSARPIRH
jgi:predicted DNA-binding protein